MPTRIDVELSDDLLAKVDACRGGQSRAGFVMRAIGAQTSEMLPPTGPFEQAEFGRWSIAPADPVEALARAKRIAAEELH